MKSASLVLSFLSSAATLSSVSASASSSSFQRSNIRSLSLSVPLEDDNDKRFQFTSDDGKFQAFWYVPPNDPSLVKVQYVYDFDAAISDSAPKWVGFGLRDPSTTTMGPGQYYTGQSDSLAVTERTLNAAQGKPDPVAKSSVVASGCEVDGSRLICSILRPVAADSAPAAMSAANSTIVMWAMGDVQDKDISIHSKEGFSGAINLVDTSPTLRTYGDNGFNISWMPLPGNLDIDFYLRYDFSTASSALSAGLSDPAASWIGLGFGTAATTMGPGQFYTGQGDTLEITDRFLASGSTYPDNNPDPNLVQGSCAIDGSIMNCQLTRPVKTTSKTQIDLSGEKPFLKYAMGPVSGGGISQHTTTGASSVGLNFTELAGNGTAPPAPPGKTDYLMYKLHGSFMIVAWLVLLPFGVYVARFRDTAGLGKYEGMEGAPMWWRVHQPLQYIGVALMIAAVVIIFVKAGTDTPYDLHKIFGLVSFGLTLSQPVFALIRNGLPSCSEEQQHRCHHIWHWVHGIGGYGGLVTAMIALALGIGEYSAINPAVLASSGGQIAGWPTYFFIGYCFSVGCFSLAFVVSLLLGIAKHCRKKGSDRELTLLDATAKPEQAKWSWLVWILFLLLVLGGSLALVSVVL